MDDSNNIKGDGGGVGTVGQTPGAGRGRVGGKGKGKGYGIDLDKRNDEMNTVFDFFKIDDGVLINKVNELIKEKNNKPGIKNKFKEVSRTDDMAFEMLRGNAEGLLYQSILKRMGWCLELIWGHGHGINPESMGMPVAQQPAFKQASLWWTNTTQDQRDWAEDKYKQHVLNVEPPPNDNININNSNNNNSDIDMVNNNNNNTNNNTNTKTPSNQPPPKKRQKIEENDSKKDESRPTTNIPNNNPNELGIE